MHGEIKQYIAVKLKYPIEILNVSEEVYHSLLTFRISIGHVV